MSSIIISADNHEICQSIGEKVAEALGYQHLSVPFLENVAKQYNVSEEKLRRVLDASTGRMSSKTRNLFLSYVQAATLEELTKDGIVCTDLAAHLYVRGVSHVLSVRVLANAERRATLLAAQKQITLQKAWKLMEREEANNIRWSTESFGVAENSPALYDLVVSLSQIEISDMVELLKETLNSRDFLPMTYSRKCLRDLMLGSKVRAALLPDFPVLRVKADGDRAIVHVKCSKRQKNQTVQKIKEIAGALPEVSLVEVHAASSLPSQEEEQQSQVVMNDE